MKNLIKIRLALFFSLTLLNVPGIAQNKKVAEPQYDLVILNGRVIDPETKLDAIRNIGISGGIIQEISENKITGKETIEAKGLVVSPGFIDTHWHGVDEYGVKIGLRDGVTSPLELEMGVYPVDGFYKEREGKSQANYGASVSHMAARIAILDKIDPKGSPLYGSSINESFNDGAKWNTNPYSPEETNLVVKGMEKELRQGGLGIGFAIGYFVKVGSPEVMAIANLANRYKSYITTHVRYLSQIPPSGYLGLEEMVAVAKLNNVPLLVHHVPSNCLGLTENCLDLIDEARSQGYKIAGEFYPYNFASSGFAADYLKPGFQERIGMEYSDIVYVKTGEKMTEELFNKYLKEDPSGTVIFYSMKEKDMMAALKRPGVFVGSDAMPLVASDGKPLTWDSPYGDGKGHPRAAGTHARLLKMVREQNAIPLMEAIAKLSFYQAQFLEDVVPDMKKRGRLQPGAIADITIFDFNTVQDNADWKEGMNSLPSTGIPYVVVNGTIVVKDSEVLKGVYPGQPIRNKILD
ncbi:N-acyl-D-glutamate deacylase [Algoriphagus boseongensis]|uniref:N-acyl-D-glutamate deacylase n=1 Tax=Algoriphagus boseongensis TaxID=1442587 RepID=A0A4R6T7V8_9BACT|nr:amidohydrolase family protein [Algoriphagus boseongensis]TDQ19288.1 N-acyl-D-glutamate deacylase [Algoriphagus boseongensis]